MFILTTMRSVMKTIFTIQFQIKIIPKHITPIASNFISKTTYTTSPEFVFYNRTYVDQRF